MKVGAEYTSAENAGQGQIYNTMSETESKIHFFFILPFEIAQEVLKLWKKEQRQAIFSVVLTNSMQDFVAFESVFSYIQYKKLQILLSRNSFDSSVFEMREEKSPFQSKLTPYFLNEFMEMHSEFLIKGIKL